MKKEEVSARIASIGEQCLTCHPKANTLAELQDLIEDAGVDLMEVTRRINMLYNQRHESPPADNQYVFVDRGRLRVHKGQQCINVRNFGDAITALLE